jgi:anti-sigma factor RsiW
MPTTKILYERLVDLADGRLTSEERDALLDQIAASPTASRELAQLERLIALMRADDEDAPPHVIQRAIRLFNQNLAPSPPRLRQRLAALLQFDSAQQQAMGVRSGKTTARQLLFSTADHDLDLRVTAKGGLWVVAGQLLGPCADGQAELQSSTFQVQAALNELCEFTLPPAPNGNYTLSLHLSDVDIEIVGLAIGV